MKLHTPWLMLITEPTNNLPAIVSEAITGGVTIVQWRQKTALKSGYDRTYSSLRAVVQEAVPLVVNTMWEVAVKLRVSNLHLPEQSVAMSVARKAVGAKALIGKSVHTVQAAIDAASEGANYLVAGTIFPSVSHPDKEPEGLDFLHAVCQSVTIPVIAVGGITTSNLGSCLLAGASGVAVLSPIMQSKSPSTVARSYRDALESAWIAR